MSKQDVKFDTIDDVPLKQALVGDQTLDPNYTRSLKSGTMRGEQRIDGTLILNDESNDRVLLGIQEGGFGTKNLGFKISQEGVDVQDATSNELIMSSAFNMFKIVESGTFSMTKPANDASHLDTYDFQETYTETPTIFAYFDIAGAGTAFSTLPYMIFDSSGNMELYITNRDITKNDALFEIRAPSSGSYYVPTYTATIKVFVLAETVE